MRRSGLAIALALLLVLAGCSAPTTTGVETTTTPNAGPEETTTLGEQTTTETTTTPNQTGASQGAIEVRDGTLPFNATVVFDRVRRLLGADVPYPDLVDIQEPEKMTTQARGLPEFAQTMGIGDETNQSREVRTLGVTRGANYVALNAILLNHSDQAKAVLVHEFVHIVQNRQGSLDTAYENVQPGSTDSHMTYLAIVEGIPVFIEGAYHETYGTPKVNGMTQMVQGYERASGVHKYALAPYAFGAQYAESRAGTASNVSTLYENPPETTEAIIHDYGQGEEPIRTLRSNITTDGWRWSDSDRLGELFIRQVLVTEMNESRAAVAAEGWGADRQFTFSNDNQTGYVWALRWDTVEDADEFETATRIYLDSRGETQDTYWRADNTSFRLVRTSPEVVVLVIGRDNFVAGTSVSSTNASVSIDTNASAAT